MKKFGLFFISAFMMVLEGLRDRYIGSLFRVDEPVPDDSGLLSYSTFKVFSGPPLQNIDMRSALFSYKKDTKNLKRLWHYSK